MNFNSFEFLFVFLPVTFVLYHLLYDRTFVAAKAVLLLASLTEYFFMLYEQFYVIEEATSKLFLFKLLELATLYGLITSSVATSPIRTIAGLVVIRIVGLVLIATHAWATWKVAPPLKPSRYTLTAGIVTGLLIAILTR